MFLKLAVPRACWPVTACVMLTFWACLNAEVRKPRIAILTLENPAQYRQSNIGNGLTGIITTELGRNGKYEIVDRQVLEVLRNELRLGASDAANPQAAAGLGQFQGAEYYLKGQVSVFSLNEKTRQLQRIDHGMSRSVVIYDKQADVRIDFQLINVKTTKAVLTERGIGSAHATGESSEMASFLQVLRSGSFATAEANGSLIGRATEIAVSDLVRRLNNLSSEVEAYTSTDDAAARVDLLEKLKGHVLAVANDQVVVDIGAENGVKSGDKLIAYSETPIRNQKGEVVLNTTKEVARLEIVDTAAARDRSMAKVTSGGVKEGYLVKVDVEGVSASRAAQSVAGGIEARSTSVDVTALMRKGDRFYEDGNYSQALEQYQRADAQKRGDAEVLNKVLRADLKLRDFLAVEDTMTSMLDRNVPISIAVIHRHALTYCTGALSVTKEGLSFSADKGKDAFSGSKNDISAVQAVISGVSGFMRGLNEQPPARLSLLQITLRTEGKDRKYDFLPRIFAKEGGAIITVDPADEQDAMKFTNLLQRVVQHAVR